MSDAAAPGLNPVEGVLALAGVVLLAYAWWKGHFREQTFEDAPARAAFAPFDLAAGGGLWLAGMTGAAALTGGLAGRVSFMTAALITQVIGWLPLLIYGAIRIRSFPKGFLDLGLELNGRILKSTGLFLAAAFPLTVLAGAAGALVMRALGLPAPVLAHRMLQELEKNPGAAEIAALAVSAVVVAAAAEEFFFRRLIQKTLGSVWKRRWPAIGATSVFFTVVHLPVIVVAMPAEVPGNPDRAVVAWSALGVLFTLSAVLGFAYEKTGSLWTPVLLHAAFNALQLAVVLLAPVNG